MGTPGGTAEAPHKKTFWLEIVTIVVSAFAIGASIVTVIASNSTSQAVAQYQEGAETERSRSEFLREQRRDAYASYLRETYNLIGIHDELSEDASLESNPEWNERVRAAESQWTLARSNVLIVGSPDVIAATDRIEANYTYMAFQSIPVPEPVNGATTQSSTTPSVSGMSIDYSLVNEFISAAQQDIQE